MHVLDYILGLLMNAARWLIILVLSLMHPELYSPWSGEVVGVVRPHEIRVQRSKEKIETVRVYGIHCPLGAKPFAKEAREYVIDRVLHRRVKVQPLPGIVKGPWYSPDIEAHDSYGRVMGLVTVDGKSLNEELLRKGIAWWYEPLVPFERGYKRLEDLAHEEAIGLWQYPDPTPAWNFKATHVGETNPLQADILAQSLPRSEPQPETKPDQKLPGESATKNEKPSQVPAPPHAEISPEGKVAPYTSQELASPPKHEPPANDCRNEEYVEHLTAAYNAVAGLTAIYWYTCSQVGINWEERGTIVRDYEPPPGREREAEALLRSADNPCPESVRVHEDVRKLWALCLEMKSLSKGVGNDRDQFEQKLALLREKSAVLMTSLKREFASAR